MTQFKPPIPETVDIPGPVGSLEALVEVPPASPGATVAVVCHPHPQHGGTMQNKVVHMLARAFQEQGAATIRFNYRGVGRSEGGYDEGRGETDDAVAVLDFAATRWPGAILWLGGFSFGGAVAYRAATRRPIARLILVAPAVQRVDAHPQPLPCPCLIVQGDQDEVIEPALVTSWVAALPRAPDFVVLPGVGHFFHGHLDELRSTARQWLEG